MARTRATACKMEHKGRNQEPHTKTHCQHTQGLALGAVRDGLAPRTLQRLLQPCAAFRTGTRDLGTISFQHVLTNQDVLKLVLKEV